MKVHEKEPQEDMEEKAEKGFRRSMAYIHFHDNVLKDGDRDEQNNNEDRIR